MRRTPTASAIVADLVSVAMGTTGEIFKRLKIYPDQTPQVKVLPFDQLKSRYYMFSQHLWNIVFK